MAADFRKSTLLLLASVLTLLFYQLHFLVTKFVYSDSVESNTIKLHEEIAAGRIQFTAKGISHAALQVLLHDV